MRKPLFDTKLCCCSLRYSLYNSQAPFSPGSALALLLRFWTRLLSHFSQLDPPCFELCWLGRRRASFLPILCSVDSWYMVHECARKSQTKMSKEDTKLREIPNCSTNDNFRRHLIGGSERIEQQMPGTPGELTFRALLDMELPNQSLTTIPAS